MLLKLSLMLSITEQPHQTADGVAAGMKSWAIENGATHIATVPAIDHSTWRKHDAFIDLNEQALLKVSPKVFIREPDAFLRLSGGIRQTLWGYTAWDAFPPAFIVGTTLCIPTIFISYTGEALDYKVLLESPECS